MALPPDLARQLVAGSEGIVEKLDEGDECAASEAAQTLRRQTIEAINAGRVPAALQEELQGSVNELAETIRCGATGASTAAAERARELRQLVRELSP